MANRIFIKNSIKFEKGFSLYPGDVITKTSSNNKTAIIMGFVNSFDTTKNITEICLFEPEKIDILNRLFGEDNILYYEDDYNTQKSFENLLESSQNLRDVWEMYQQENAE